MPIRPFPIGQWLWILFSLGVLLFLHLPLLVIVLYAFSPDEATLRFPLPGLTWHWFAVAWGRADIWRALFLSLRVAVLATGVAVVLGSLAAAAVYRSRFFGRETISFLVLLPIALPGIVSGIALRSAIHLLHIPFS
ncbi:ABC-type spermidine/putrescine transport system permease subunit II [Thermostichus sp. MS-CIW-40]